MKIGACVLLALALLAAAPAAAMAEEFVTVTSVTIDPVATLCETRGCVIVTGTITCDGVGAAELVNLDVYQGRVQGFDDFDLLDFACSTEPRPYTIVAENYLDQRFHPGRATAVASIDGSVVASATVRTRR